jgi:hypothetical protein
MIWACDEVRGTKAIRVVMKMKIEGKRGRGREKPKKRRLNTIE